MTRKAGAIVIDQLRQRIRLGRYFSRWRPGDRLPSVREIATLEGVDRKTAAAAYRQLQAEGLVRIAPRSGVYLEDDASSEHGDPLARLHGQWLENALATAEDLGLDVETLHGLFRAVASVRKRRIPVIDPDPDHAGQLARELRARTGLDCEAISPGELPADAGPVKDAPFLVVTPAGREALSTLARRIPAVLISLERTILDAVSRAARDGPTSVVVGSRSLEQNLRDLLDGEGDGLSARVEIRHIASDTAPLEDGTGTLVVCPGVPDWKARAVTGASRPERLIDGRTVARIRSQIARIALENLSTSTGSATPRPTAGESRPR